MPGGRDMREVRFGAEGVTLAGLLGVPGGEAVAGVVLVGGSGPSDRDDDGYFRSIRRYLLDAGIAVLSYEAALDFLRAQSEVPDGAAGSFGHSEGGWVALRAAARDAPSWGHHQQLPWRDPCGFAEATRIVAEAGNPPGLAAFWTDVDAGGWEFLKRKQDHDPLPDALRLRCPRLAVFGGADELVPVADSIRLFSDAACDGDRGHRVTLTVEVFPGADHRVRRDGVLAPGYLSTLARWIHAAARG
ncbi:alpha/beta hydrolase family protein [Spirillospora sp. CA-108201]